MVHLEDLVVGQLIKVAEGITRNPSRNYSILEQPENVYRVKSIVEDTYEGTSFVEFEWASGSAPTTNFRNIGKSCTYEFNPDPEKAHTGDTPLLRWLDIVPPFQPNQKLIAKQNVILERENHEIGRHYTGPLFFIFNEPWHLVGPCLGSKERRHWLLQRWSTGIGGNYIHNVYLPELAKLLTVAPGYEHPSSPVDSDLDVTIDEDGTVRPTIASPRPPSKVTHLHLRRRTCRPLQAIFVEGAASPLDNAFDLEQFTEEEPPV